MIATTCTTLVVSLFGKPKFYFGDAELRLPVAKTTLTVLAYLLLNRSGPHRRDDVAFAIWPDDTESDARANLRRHVYLLSRALPHGDSQWIVSGSRLVEWNAGAPLQLDVEAFARLASDPTTRARALDLYAGDLLEDIEADWLGDRRRHYRELFCDVALEAARDALEAGEFAHAASIAQRVIAVDSWREDAVRTVISCRLRGGDRAGALVTYLEFQRRLREELDTDPMPQTQALYETIVTGVHSPPSRMPHVPRSTLPDNLSRFVGREREVATVASALERCRLVTLIGPGGVGKSRLAIRVAESIRQRFAGEPLFVELATITNEKRSFEAKLLEAFGFSPTHENIVDVLSRTLGSHKRLVILDNAEHVIAEAGRFLAALFARSGTLTVLATSRRPLHLDGEQTIVLRPHQLPAPNAPLEAAMQSEAATLFVDRARSFNSEMCVSSSDAKYIVAICRRLDGIPLAIELAAARSNALTPKEIDARLSDRFTLLRTRNVDALRHHQTLRATLDWSFDLLDEQERRAFCRLGVFENGWTLEAASEVISLGGKEDVDALESLTRLIDQSLVVMYEVDGSCRYDYLETIRAYALLRLSESNEVPLVRRAAGDYFVRYVDEKRRLFGSLKEKVAFDCVALEHDNILAVIDEAIARGDAGLAARLSCWLSSYWVVRGFVVDAHWRVESVCDIDGDLDPNLRGRLRNVASILHSRRGEIAQSMKRATEALVLSRASGDEDVTAEALLAQARYWYASDALASVTEALEEALAIFKKQNDRLGIARSLDFLALISDLQRDGGTATALYRQSLSIYEERGDLQGVATVNYHLGFQAYERGEHAVAIAFSTKAIDVWREYGNLQGENWAQYNVACAEAALGLSENATFRHLACVLTAHRRGFIRDVSDGLERLAGLTLEYAPALTARCMGYAAHLRERYGHAVLAIERKRYDDDAMRVEELLGEIDFPAAWKSGAAADQETLIETISSVVKDRYHRCK